MRSKSAYKILDNEVELETFLSQARSGKSRVVFTNGCFDILHAGHLHSLEKASNFGDILIVGVNSDESVSRLKGSNRPIVAEKQRLQLLAGLECVDGVISFSEDTPLNLIQKVKPDILIKGGDYTIDNIVGADFVIQNGGMVEIIQFEEDISTSKIINKIKKL